MDEQHEYTVRTLYLSHFREAAAAVAEQRRNPTSTQDLASAMRRLELADKALEGELNRFAEQGYELVAAVELQTGETARDLMLTAIFQRQK